MKQIDWNKIIKAYELLLQTGQTGPISGDGWKISWHGIKKIQITIEYE